ncbi:hypothetical protein DNU06_06750 [Putridiphycobacter roseus]|uniref:histidine kinase n=1 Tax=Putridiphycobacter roseus TaxID=2219161 RepID=A0A2W1N3C1_9FLAO|nr:PAS domain S-box protein [Putridiphycobacter roseus]PZE17521.1 hypothetical protein DNU06_06750 [Putridiphycobacter roseus]
MKEKDLFQNIFESSPEGILVIASHGVIQKINTTAAHVFGYEPKELINNHIEKLIAVKFRASYTSYIEKNIGNSKRELRKGKKALWGLNKSGETFSFDASLNHAVHNNQPVIIAHISDNSKRLLDLKTAKDSRFELLEVQSIAEVGSWTWNLETNERNWSDEFYRIYGLIPGDIRLNGDNIYDFTHPLDRDKIEKILQDIIKDLKPQSYETRISRPDNSIRYLSGKIRAVCGLHGKANFLMGTIQDITAIKEAQLATIESNRKFNTLINNLHGIVYRCHNNRNWEMQYINDSCSLITGYPAQEFIDKNIHFGQLILKEDKEMVWNKIEEAIKLKIPYSLEYRIKDKAGNIKHVWEQGQDVYDKAGKEIMLEGFISDISHTKEAENKLFESKARNKAIIKALPDSILVLNRKGDYLDVQTQEKNLFLSRKSALIGKNAREILPKALYKKMMAAFENCHTTKSVQIIKYSNTINGQLNHFEARIVKTEIDNFLIIIRNISSEKELENTLYIRNKALESAVNGFVIADARQKDYPIIYANDSIVKITGYSKDEILGQNPRFLQENDLDQDQIKIMNTSIKEGNPCRVVLRNYKKDGTLFWNEVTLTPIFSDDHKVTHIVGIQNDVTKRKKEELLKEKVKHVLEMIIQHEPIVYISRKIVRILENTMENCIASISVLNESEQTLHLLASPNLPKEFTKAIEGIVIGPNQGSCGAAAYLKKDVIIAEVAIDPNWGNYKELANQNGIKACWSFPLFSSSKKVLGTLAIYSKSNSYPSDVENDVIADMVQLASVAIEQNNSRIELDYSKLQLKQYAESLEEKVAKRTLALKKVVGQLEHSNTSLENQINISKSAKSMLIKSQEILTGIAENFPKGFIAVIDANLSIQFIQGEELAELGFREYIHNKIKISQVVGVPKSIKKLVENYVLKTLKGEHCSFEINFQERNYLVNTTPLLNKEKNVVEVLLVHNNISAQKKIEKDIRKTLQKEKELNELKSRFISMASHEFRTPLAAINTSAILIKKQNDAGKEEKREKYVDQIKSNVKNLVTILNDFLSISKLEEKKVDRQLEALDIIAFSKAIITEIKPTKKNGQSINLISDFKEKYIVLDPKILHHILINLLSNAIKYSSENKSIVLNIYGDELYLFIEVTDQGIGIPENEQKNMFERFYRAKNVSNIEGTGLGLNIVKSYTELLQGSISFKSKINEGTTFVLKLPLK